MRTIDAANEYIELVVRMRAARSEVEYAEHMLRLIQRFYPVERKIENGGGGDGGSTRSEGINEV